MELEDNIAYLQREKDKCVERMIQTQRYHEQVSQDKKRWESHVEMQKVKLNQLVDEKLE